MNMGIHYKTVPVQKMNLKVKKKAAERWSKILEAREEVGSGLTRRTGNLNSIG